MVQLVFDHYCTVQGTGIEKCLCGVVGFSFIYAEVHEELYLVSWAWIMRTSSCRLLALLG